MILFIGGGLVLFILCAFVYIAKREESKDDVLRQQLIMWPEQEYPKFCNVCGKKLHKIEQYLPLHYNSFTGQAELYQVELRLSCGYWFKDYGPLTFAPLTGHFEEVIDKYEMILSGDNKRKRKNHSTENLLDSNEEEEKLVDSITKQSSR